MKQIKQHRGRKSASRPSALRLRKQRRSGLNYGRRRQSPPISSSVCSSNQARSVHHVNPEPAQSAIPIVQTIDNPESPALSRYDIMRFPVIDWQFRWQRPQQLSEQFALQGHRVFYVSPVIIGIGVEEASREQISRQIKVTNIDRNIWMVTLCAKRPLNLYQDQMDHWDIQYLLWSVEHVREKFGLTQLVSIVDLPFWTPLVDAMDQHQIIYDCMDHHAGFTTNDKTMLLEEEQLLQRAGLVVTTSQHLFDWAAPYNPSTVLIRNAADTLHFSNPPNDAPPELADIHQPIIGYYGAISDWFDIQLIETLAKNRPDWAFVLIGHTFGCDTSSVEKLNNVWLLGEKPYHELPAYLHRFHVALIPFVKNELTQATNPVKLYEYLAAGKPVVSTELPEVKAVAPNLVKIAGTPVQFEEAIEAALLESDDHIIEQRQQFAKLNNWNRRYEALHADIMKYLYPKVSIILVVHNNWSYTQQCLHRLLQPGHYPNLEVIIVDNASTDQTSSCLRILNHPLIKVITSSTNLGFAAGNTLGCGQSTGEYIILLNNDTLVPDGSWISRLLRPFQEDDMLAMTGPMSNHVGNDQALDHFIGDAVQGAHPRWLSEFYEHYRRRYRYTDLLGFFCVALRRSVWEHVGALDPAYGIGMFEDDDYCERVRSTGYRLAIVEDAFVYHHGSVTIKKLKDHVYDALWNKNKAFYEQKWRKPWRMPKGPDSIFHMVDRPEDIATRVNQAGKKVVLVLGLTVWETNTRRWQQIVKGLCEDENLLVVVYTHVYLGDLIVGTRKIGPRLYFTNRIDLFSEVRFDQVVYCGSTDTHPQLQADHYWADSLSYHEQQLKSLLAQNDNLQVWDSIGVSQAVQQVRSASAE
ncbi:glycosyltransferase [Paenibacillus solani]|uniref:Glycosyl transferase family 2 n=1 Tax=Paenibacillus solani TaxID=1705565 RepID=A0A0M1P540_9BACL|nr:glycosyltransferase [Paenibacillus solani]KOR89611.1 glycosyl transferase family 2 [Paenibacillus solani]